MKKFRFTLQPVATLRNLQEMRASEGFARAIREEGLRRQELARQTERVAEFVTAMIAGRSGGLSGAIQAGFNLAYRQELAAEKAATEALTAAAQQREQARLKWIDAHLQVKLIEKLRGRARARHAAELQRVEQNQLDDRTPRGSVFSES